jgi:hypothetical protein
MLLNYVRRRGTSGVSVGSSSVIGGDIHDWSIITQLGTFVAWWRGK